VDKEARKALTPLADQLKQSGVEQQRGQPQPKTLKPEGKREKERRSIEL